MRRGAAITTPNRAERPRLVPEARKSRRLRRGVAARSISSSRASLQYEASTLKAMRAITRWLEPDWRLNPGVLIDP